MKPKSSVLFLAQPIWLHPPRSQAQAVSPAYVTSPDAGIHLCHKCRPLYLLFSWNPGYFICQVINPGHKSSSSTYIKSPCSGLFLTHQPRSAVCLLHKLRLAYLCCQKPRFLHLPMQQAQVTAFVCIRSQTNATGCVIYPHHLLMSQNRLWHLPPAGPILVHLLCQKSKL